MVLPYCPAIRFFIRLFIRYVGHANILQWWKERIGTPCCRNYNVNYYEQQNTFPSSFSTTSKQYSYFVFLEIKKEEKRNEPFAYDIYLRFIWIYSIYHGIKILLCFIINRKKFYICLYVTLHLYYTFLLFSRWLLKTYVYSITR